jgi:hypothetical protein
VCSSDLRYLRINKKNKTMKKRPVSGSVKSERVGQVPQGQKGRRSKSNVSDIEVTETEIYKILKVFKLQQYAKVTQS